MFKLLKLPNNYVLLVLFSVKNMLKIKQNSFTETACFLNYVLVNEMDEKKPLSLMFVSFSKNTP